MSYGWYIKFLVNGEFEGVEELYWKVGDDCGEGVEVGGR